MARLFSPVSKAFRSPDKFPVSGPTPSQSVASSAFKQVRKHSMLPRPKSQSVRKTPGRRFLTMGPSRPIRVLPAARADYEATNEVSASQIPRPVTAALKAVSFRRCSQIIRRLQKLKPCPVTAGEPKADDLCRPLLAKQAHAFYRPASAPGNSKLPFLVWPLVRQRVKSSAISLGKRLLTSVAKAAPTTGAVPVNTTATFDNKHLDGKAHLPSVNNQVISALEMPVKAALKSAMRRCQGKRPAKTVQFTEGPFSTKLYSTSESVEHFSAVSASLGETVEWDPLVIPACRPYDVSESGKGTKQIFSLKMDGSATMKRAFLNRYAAVRRAEELRREEAAIAGKQCGLGQLEYGNADYKIGLHVSGNLITRADVGMLLEPKEISGYLPSSMGRMLVFNRFDADLEDTTIPRGRVVPTKEPVQWPLKSDSTQHKIHFHAVTLRTIQVADLEA